MIFVYRPKVLGKRTDSNIFGHSYNNNGFRHEDEVTIVGCDHEILEHRVVGCGHLLNRSQLYIDRGDGIGGAVRLIYGELFILCRVV